MVVFLLTGKQVKLAVRSRALATDVAATLHTHSNLWRGIDLAVACDLQKGAVFSAEPPSRCSAGKSKRFGSMNHGGM